MYACIINTSGCERFGGPDFKDTKTEGFIEVSKEWEGGKPDDKLNIKVSTQKPTKNPLGITVTFLAEDGGIFPNSSRTNDIIYSRSGRIVPGDYLI